MLPNPVADAELPSWGIDRQRAVRAPSADEVRALLVGAYSVDERFGAFVRLIVATGMRRGECCAIRWSDVDLDHATVRVDESVVATSGGAETKSPKTQAVVTLFEHHRALAADADRVLDAEAFAFSFEPGGTVPPHPDTMSHLFAVARKESGIAEDLHLHSLRHFQATAIDAVVSERQKQARLGWSSALMARHYTDVVTEEDRRAAEHVAALLADEGPE